MCVCLGVCVCCSSSSSKTSTSPLAMPLAANSLGERARGATRKRKRGLTGAGEAHALLIKHIVECICASVRARVCMFVQEGMQVTVDFN